jgi:hypothetical protein
VDGTNSKWTVSDELDIGGLTNASGGTGLLSVTNSGTVAVTSTPGKVEVYGSGTLSVTNSGTVSAASVDVGGTLTGNGMVSTTNGTSIEGTIEPSGTPPNDTLTISSGDLTFNGNAALMLSNVVPAGADNVNVSNGAASLTGHLKVTMTGTFTPGTTYTLLYARGGRNGTFLFVSINYPTNQCFTPVITYDTNHVYLYLEANCW